jgi:hypothetical protein
MADLNETLQALNISPILQAMPGGYSLPASLMDNPEQGEMAQAAAQILADPVALRTFSDKVYDYLCQDLQQQRSRQGWR